MGDAPSEKHTIDRIKNNLGYEKGNCKWSTRKEQNNNTRTNRMITWKGKTQTMAQWSSEIGIPYGTLQMRFFREWPIKRAMEWGIQKYGWCSIKTKGTSI
jgi:hypothetical protein